VKRSSLILSCFSGSFLFNITLVGVIERKKRIVDKGRGAGRGRGTGNRSSITRKMVFIYVVAIISI